LLLLYIAYATLVIAIFGLGAATAIVLNARPSNSLSSAALRFVPLMIDVALVLWVAVLGPHPYPSQKWAVYPVGAALPVAIVSHVILIAKEHERTRFIGYTAVHVPIATLIWILCWGLITGNVL